MSLNRIEITIGAMDQYNCYPITGYWRWNCVVGLIANLALSITAPEKAVVPLKSLEPANEGTKHLFIILFLIFDFMSPVY